MPTQSERVTEVWKNVVTELSLVDGTKYIMQVTGGADVLRMSSALAPDGSIIPFHMMRNEVWPFTASATVGLWVKKYNENSAVSVEEAP